MKRMICALMALALLLGAAATAEGRIAEALMIYEDYDENRAEQTVDDAATLNELEDMLLRAAKHPAELEGCTLNSTLFCMLPDGELIDFAVATDGCPYIVNNISGQVYALEDADYQRLREIFDVVYAGMGYDAGDILAW